MYFAYYLHVARFYCFLDIQIYLFHTSYGLYKIDICDVHSSVLKQNLFVSLTSCLVCSWVLCMKICIIRLSYNSTFQTSRLRPPCAVHIKNYSLKTCVFKIKINLLIITIIIIIFLLNIVWGSYLQIYKLVIM